MKIVVYHLLDGFMPLNMTNAPLGSCNGWMVGEVSDEYDISSNDVFDMTLVVDENIISGLMMNDRKDTLTDQLIVRTTEEQAQIDSAKSFVDSIVINVNEEILTKKSNKIIEIQDNKKITT